MSRPAIANPIFLALDTPSVDDAVTLAGRVRAHVGGLKVGLEFIGANGPEGVRRIVALGLPVFADVKFHDIPNTVAGAAREIAKLGAKIFNVHASGGAAMMAAAADAAKSVDPNITIIGVTVLTSLAGDDLFTVGQGDDTLLQVHRLARLAKASGLDGVVCSPREIGVIRAECGPDFLIVTPGVRPRGADAGDQRRAMTPAEAVQAGADILVVGRPITGAADPAEAARAIAAEVAAVSA
jgi:orotidine-5'-phosphate decarboxylase